MRPPLAPVRAGVAAGGDTVLRSTDGSYFSAHLAHPETPSATAVVIVPMSGACLTSPRPDHGFADPGHHAMAVDYLAALRELPPGPTTAFRDHVAQMELSNGDREVAAALSWVGGLGRVH